MEKVLIFFFLSILTKNFWKFFNEAEQKIKMKKSEYSMNLIQMFNESDRVQRT